MNARSRVTYSTQQAFNAIQLVFVRSGTDPAQV
jgi:hypothetical protein